ncbi:MULTISPECIES: phospho-N-acetylmuramoyl-pentapeptide-transferase [Anaerostipes]|uniref:phospho-N-acetylmuramoyl-pentapeptide- transferase n=1 Tax=Anaerostipes TaxID=207244 RepID=UPI0009535B0B|nr:MULTISPECIES: phospho-N-acetylmuramoyl-pentapeptide-transferase [Anaerostipes]MCI5624136.1 phospho-N-acetylmuramoyl-pentapeptide-transferase [Anaerostipes sp.]MDY2725451.1 phospho-N-acetylmuramoyl-pentapeptide-transferase [Anaerostipes faecalis]OLR60077.1 phospho-N-acetylmuramoyl-pentapeptide-transferase [Anaerostipes sp. 494a]
MNYNIVKPILIAFFVSVILSPMMIRYLHKLKFGQFIRGEGPESHLKKSGTPTMGGLIILLGIVVASLFYVRDYPLIIPILFVTLGFGFIGFIDDYIKVVMKRNLGLRAWQKMMGQIIVTGVFAYYLINYTDLGTSMIIPFTHGKYLDMGILFVPGIFIILLGTVNGANFTDGLDGLASSVTVLIATFFTVAAVGMRISGKDPGIWPISCATVGSLLGFLVFNVYPARVFMGDTGSLALGGFVAATAVMLHLPLFIPIVAFIYMIEVISVMLQVCYFKATKGKRLLKMAPIHHHFELSGWPETKVVAIFAIITAVCCLIGLVAI